MAALTMSTDERIIAELEGIKRRLDALEQFTDQAKGALTLVKFVSSVLGIGGIAAIIAALSQGRI